MTEKGDVIYPRTYSLLLAGIGLKHRSTNPPITSPQWLKK